jgi:transcriptional regulator with XRE-family HTH domain
VTAELSLFGPELRRRRQEAGLSLARLAEQVHYSKSYLSKVETGQKPAGAALARRCDAALNAGGELSALARSTRPAPVPLDPVDDGEVWVVSLAADGAGGFRPMRRRDVLSLGAASFLGIGFSTRATSAAARDESALLAFRAMFDQSRRLGQLTSPGAVLPSVITMTQALRGMASAAGSDTRGGLLLLAGRCAEYAGWMSQEAGDDRAAGWWTDRAGELAGAAGDGDLSAYTLIRQAEIALYRDDARHTIALARAAQRPGTLPRVRGLAAQREAQGHALAGDYDACRRLLDQAANLLATDQSATAAHPMLGSSTVPNLDEVITAWCLHDLGRPQDAATILDRELPRIPVSARRARARFGVRQALAHADAGEVDQACVLATELLDTVELVDSATIRLDLRRLARTLARRLRQPAVREIYPRLTAALH